jgi:hypothetical protein
VQHEVNESDDDIDYDEVPIEEFDDLSDSDGEETLEKAVRNINEKNFFNGGIYINCYVRPHLAVLIVSIAGSFEPSFKNDDPAVSLTKRPEVIDDYIRNYLASKGLFKSLEAFQVCKQGLYSSVCKYSPMIL